MGTGKEQRGALVMMNAADGGELGGTDQEHERH